MPKLLTSNFRKVVRKVVWQHTEGVVGSVIIIGFVANLPGFPAAKNFRKSVKN